MNDKNENILFKIRHKNIDNKSNNDCLKKYNDETNIDKQLELSIVLDLDNIFANTSNDSVDKEIGDNVLVSTSNDYIDKEVVDSVLVNNTNNENISEEVVDNVLLNVNSESSNKEIVKKDNKSVYSTLSNELTYFSEKINKILLDTQNMQDTFKNKFEKFVFEIRQNHIGDDEFYINNELTSEDYFMKKLLSYKK